MNIFARFSAILLLFAQLGASAQQSQNMSVFSNWNDTSIPLNGYGFRYSDCWGYADASGEYAILGSSTSIHIFNVTNPANPVEVFRFAGGTTTPWREFRTYSHYLYAVTDATTEGLRVFDLSGLPNNVTQTTQNTTAFTKCHTIHVDAVAGRLYCAGTNTQNQGLIVMDLAANPANPPVLSSVSLVPPSGPAAGYVHDCFVRNNKVYASHGNNGLFVWDFTNAAAPVMKGALTSYPEKGYNHSTWMNDAGTHLVMCDETHNTGVKMVSITDLTNLFVTDTFRSALLAPTDIGSIAHNPCIRGNIAYLSYYHDGIQAWDISNPADVQRIGYYDTETSNINYSGYAGPWGVYPYLPSGNIIGSDLKKGLYVLHLDSECSPPTSMNLGSIGTYTAIANWNDAASSTGYRIRYKAAGATTWTVVNTPNSARSFQDLDPATTYTVQVAANCGYGVTTYAKQYTFTTLAVGTCNLPFNTWASNIAATTATLNWTAVPGVTQYRVAYRRVGAAWKYATATGTSLAVANLVHNKAYEFKVASRCTGNQYSAYTAPVTFNTPLANATPDTEKQGEGTNEVAISVYPNPASEELHIELPTGASPASVMQIQIMDITGRIVLEGQYQEEGHVIFDLARVPTGAYSCVVLMGNVVTTVKFLKM